VPVEGIQINTADEGDTSSVYCRHLFLEVGIPPNLQFPQTAAALCALNLFFGRGNELQKYQGNILLVDNKHGKLSVINRLRSPNPAMRAYPGTF